MRIMSDAKVYQLNEKSNVLIIVWGHWGVSRGHIICGMEWYAVSYQLQLYFWRSTHHEEDRGDTDDKESLWTLTDEKVYKWCGDHDVRRHRDGIGLPAANIDAEGDHAWHAVESTCENNRVVCMWLGASERELTSVEADAT